MPIRGQRLAFLPGIARGEVFFSTGMSEPELGSRPGFDPYLRGCGRGRVRGHRRQGVDELCTRGAFRHPPRAYPASRERPPSQPQPAELVRLLAPGRRRAAGDRFEEVLAQTVLHATSWTLRGATGEILRRIIAPRPRPALMATSRPRNSRESGNLTKSGQQAPAPCGQSLPLGRADAAGPLLRGVTLRRQRRLLPYLARQRPQRRSMTAASNSAARRH